MELKAEKKTLKGLLATDEQQFRIPPYQRPYSWTTDQVDDLWGDLVDSLGSGHFIGSIVVAAEDENRPQVIDGQQRLTTLMLLMSVLRDQFHQLGMAQNVQRLDKRFTSDDMAEGDAYFKFRTGNANWEIFRDFVLRRPLDTERKPMTSVDSLDPEVRARNQPLIDNHRRLRDRLNIDLESLATDELRRQRLVTLEKALLEGVELVYIQVNDLGDAFLLFETLNDRGLQLSAADLLKSHVLGEIARRAGEEDVDTAALQWDGMLQDLGSDVDVSRFLRHYLLTSAPKVKKDDIFGLFKKRVAEHGPQTVLADLRIAAKSYGQFEHPDRLGDSAAARVLTDLKRLRAVTCYIALLPARRYLSEDDFVDYARLAEVLTYRYSSIVGLGTNELERQYHLAAKTLVDSKGAELAASRKILVEAMPDSEQFRVAFERASMGRQYLLKYTLQKIEQSLSPQHEKMIDVSTLVHIEHIMPQTLSEDWTHQLGKAAEQHASYVNRWGNLTLLRAALNGGASNKTFANKKPYYQDSQVRLTRKLNSHSTWGVSQIDERQRWLAEIADTLWSVPELSKVPGPERESPMSVVSTFREHVGDLWPHVEERVREATPDEIEVLAETVAGHLSDHADQAAPAQLLGAALVAMLSDWASLGGDQRSVLAATVDYFLDVDDAQPDSLESGLDDDRTVVRAACLALGRPELLE